MDKLKKILFKKYYIREMILLFFIVLSLLFLSVFSSFALFEKTVEKVGIASIQSHDLEISLSKTSITIPANETIFEDITLTNTSDISVKYKLYTTTTSNDVQVGVSNESENEASGTLSASGYAGDEKVVRIAATNNSSSSKTVTVGVESGYTHNEIVLESGNQDFDTTIEESSGYVDPSGANSPVLASGMIPVIYDETCESSTAKDNANGCWEVADTNTAWYSYNDQMWANAVTTSVASYRTASAGTEIPMSDINSMWVWIPRYRYNIPSDMGGTETTTTEATQLSTLSNNTEPKVIPLGPFDVIVPTNPEITDPPQINVIFEPGTETNGVTETIYRNGLTEGGTNTNYYTHPAFRDIDNIEYDSSTTSRGAWDEEITGFWVAKFEPGTTNATCNTSASEANCLDVDPIIKPDVQSLRYQTVSTQFITALKFAGGTFNSSTGEVTFTANANNVYGLNTTSNTTDTHMMKNTEWGAVAILSQSQYGKMGNANYTGVNKEVYKNNSGNTTTYISYTGRSSGVPPASGSSTYGTYSYNDMTCGTESAECTGTKVAYKGTGASTTGTIYGVYDMSGGFDEYTMGNWKSIPGASGFTTYPSSKYYDLYNGTSSSYITKGKAILGDATWETMGWYSDNVIFVVDSGSWASRGGYYDNASDAGVFSSHNTSGSAFNYNSFRPLLIP